MRVTQNPFSGGILLRKSSAGVSKRRELWGLLGASLIFFIGMPGHSIASLESTQHIVKQFVRLILVFLGLIAPTTITPPQTAVKKITPVRVMKKVTPVVPNVMHLNTYSNLKHYTYRFEGKASYRGIPCANASVLVRIISDKKVFAKGGITNEDGTYSIEVPVVAIDGAPVDWRVEAFTSEFRKLELSGRRIVQEEEELKDDPIVVTTPVEFTVTSSK